MKKIVFLITVLLMLPLGACSNSITTNTSAGTTGASDTQAEGITMLDGGVWPANEYTVGLPVPPGTVSWAALDTGHRNCSINIANISESDSNDYVELLKQEGFSLITDVSEEIKGQDYVSVGTLLSDGEKGLSIAYGADNFTIYITFIE